MSPWRWRPMVGALTSAAFLAIVKCTRFSKTGLEQGGRPVFADEGTGSFGAGLCRELLADGYYVVEINRRDRSTRHQLGKDDAIDVDAAAGSFLAGTATITPKGGNHLVEIFGCSKGNKGSSGVTGAAGIFAELMVDLAQLTQQACPGLRQTYGIGTDGAATLLVSVG